MKKTKTPIGKKIGNLTILKEVINPKEKHTHVLVRDDFGYERVVRLASILNGESLGKTVRHGLVGHHLFSTWTNMKGRCRNKNDSSYKNYGGRGIKVCKEWLIFPKFLEDMEPSFRTGLTLDRIDVNGNYCKENCRWATMKEQCNNRRNNITFNGETIESASKRLGCELSSINARLKDGWTLEEAFTTPIKIYKSSIKNKSC